MSFVGAKNGILSVEHVLLELARSTDASIDLYEEAISLWRPCARPLEPIALGRKHVVGLALLSAGILSVGRGLLELARSTDASFDHNEEAIRSWDSRARPHEPIALGRKHGVGLAWFSASLGRLPIRGIRALFGLVLYAGRGGR